MWVRRRHRLITVLVAVASLLFMQLAVAAYDCPVDNNVAAIAAMAEAGMPCAGDMASIDLDQPGLCHVHCQSAQQAVEKVQVPAPPAGAIATGFSHTLEPARTLLSAVTAPAPPLLRSTAVPLAVRNCCLRI